MEKIKNLDQMISTIKQNQHVRDQISNDPEKGIKDNFTIIPDTPIYRYVVVFLGLSLILIVFGYFVITIAGRGSLDSAIVAIASAAVGALTGLLAPQPHN